MAGTKEGAIKGRDRRLAKNPNYYKEIARKAGSVAAQAKRVATIKELHGNLPALRASETKRRLYGDDFFKKMAQRRWERVKMESNDRSTTISRSSD